MSSTTELNLCRVCANPFESSTMIRLFDEVDGPLALAEIFLQISGITVQAGDARLPKSCCLHCNNRLQEVENLRSLCQESDRKLRKMIGYDLEEKEEEGEEHRSYEIDSGPKMEVFEFSESFSCWDDLKDRFGSGEGKITDFVEEKKATSSSNRKVKADSNSAAIAQLDPKKINLSNSGNDTESEKEIIESSDPDFVDPVPKRAKKTTSEGTSRPAGEPTGKRKRVFQCSLCGQIFASSYNLKEHESVHNPDRLIKFPLCPKEFTRRNNYKRHMVVHKELFKCPECDRSYCNGATLEEHIKTKHRGERPYQCEQCPKTYLTSASLYSHVLAIHKQNLRFKCDICFKSFLTKTILERHTMKHQGIKSSHCPHCDNKYESNNYLRQHIAERHPEKMEKLSRCVYCGLGYTADCHYRKHVAKKHPERLGEFDEWLKEKRESVKKVSN